jgi:hypothetical protein
MPGRKDLRNIRFRAEAVNGTKVTTGRYIYRGNGEMIHDTREVKSVEMQVGVFGGTDETYIPQLMAEMELAEVEATFEQLSDLFLMAGFATAGGGNQAGSAQGASGSTTVFTLAIPAFTAPTTFSYTVEAGNGTAAAGVNGLTEVMEYTLADELKLSFGGGEAMMVSASLVGRQGTATNAEGTFSNVGTLVNVETILASLGSFWISPVGSGFGTGPVTKGNILAGELTFKPIWARKFPVDAGVLAFHTAVYTGMEISGELTLEGQTSGTYGAYGSAGQKEKWRSQQPQLIRMSWPGGAIAEGTTYLTKLLQIDLPFKLNEVDVVDDQDGNDIVAFSFLSKYNQSTPTAGRGTVTIVRIGTSEFSGA